MSFKPYFQLYRNRQLFALTAIAALLKPFYRIAFLAGARESGLLQMLSDKPIPFEQLAAEYCRDAKAREALAAWLQLGVRLGQLQMDSNGYSLKGLAKKLADPGTMPPWQWSKRSRVSITSSSRTLPPGCAGASFGA